MPPAAFACHGVRSQPVSVALVGECSIPVRVYSKLTLAS
jgi:hypothetical protein